MWFLFGCVMVFGLGLSLGLPKGIKFEELHGSCLQKFPLIAIVHSGGCSEGPCREEIIENTLPHRRILTKKPEASTLSPEP